MMTIYFFFCELDNNINPGVFYPFVFLFNTFYFKLYDDTFSIKFWVKDGVYKFLIRSTITRSFTTARHYWYCVSTR